MRNLIYLFFFISRKKMPGSSYSNANYDSIAKLANTVNDAKLIAKTLDSLNFELIQELDNRKKIEKLIIKNCSNN